jgi:hypothetical protein
MINTDLPAAHKNIDQFVGFMSNAIKEPSK